MRFLLISNDSHSLIGFRKPLIQDLVKKGLEVHVVAPNIIADTKAVNILESLGVKCHNIQMNRVGISPILDTKTLILLWSLIKRIQPDYVLGYTIKPVIYGTLAAWIARIPNRYALINGLGIAFTDESQRKRDRLVRFAAENLYKIALPRCHLVFFQNPDDEYLFREKSIIPDKVRTSVVNGSGVDIKEYPYSSVTPPPPIRFLLIARLLVSKGIREFAEAAKYIKQRYPEVEFDLVGSIDSNPDSITQEELQEWVDSDHINYLGQLEDVRPTLRKSSVYVLPSFYREGVPRSIIEAMSIGRAIITTDTPGCRETVENNYNGYLILPRNPDSLIDAMEKFILNPQLIKQMGEASHIIAKKKYDVRKVNDKMLKEMGL